MRKEDADMWSVRKSMEEGNRGLF